jgi:hypothetical protein
MGSTEDPKDGAAVAAAVFGAVAIYAVSLPATLVTSLRALRTNDKTLRVSLFSVRARPSCTFAKASAAQLHFHNDHDNQMDGIGRFEEFTIGERRFVALAVYMYVGCRGSGERIWAASRMNIILACRQYVLHGCRVS